ncbi:TPA: hypothetical protein ACSIXH_003654 [Acinetobacter baumannii]
MAGKLKEKNKEYMDKYNYTFSDLKKMYEDMRAKAETDAKELVILSNANAFSDKFETPMFTMLDRNLLHATINKYVQGINDDEMTEDERIEIYGYYYKRIKKVFLTLDKRCTDWLIRQQKITRHIQNSIIRLLELDYQPTAKDIHELGIDLHNAGVRYRESQLDLITLKAVKDLLPMFEMELFIKQYDQNIEKLMMKWNKHNKELHSRTGKSIGAYITNRLNFADTLYNKKINLLDTESKFYKNIDGFSGEFLDEEQFNLTVFTVGDVYDE